MRSRAVNNGQSRLDDKELSNDVEEAEIKSSSSSRRYDSVGENSSQKWMIAMPCLGIFFGVFLSLSIQDKSHAMLKKPIKRLHRNVKNAYGAHNVARKEYLRSYQKEVSSGCQNMPDRTGYDKFGIQVNNSWFHHIHIAKTAGSTMNKRLARRYYGVCGNKYTSCIEPLEHTSDDRAPEFGDSLHKDWSFDSMTKKGFHDCTLVSHERDWDAWVKQVLPDHKFHANATMVMLLPCRDPLEHFFSQCNYNMHNATKIFANVTSCEEGMNNCGLVAQNRFDINMIQSWDKVVLFKHSAFDSVFSLLDNHIPLRKFLLESKFDPSTNAERKPENEKLSKMCSKEKLVEALRKKWSYYSFCDKLRGNLTVLDVGVNGTVTVVEPVT
ncbi:unnamed protein product [Bathycoccus prasinos]